MAKRSCMVGVQVHVSEARSHHLKSPTALRRHRGTGFLLLCLAWLTVGAPLAAAVSVDPASIDAQIREVFERRCAECHASSLKKPEGKFGYIDDLPRVAANEDYVVPGEPMESELYLLLTDPDPDWRMPPPDSERSGTMTAAEIKLVADWIVLLGAGHEIRPPDSTTPPTPEPTASDAPATEAEDGADTGMSPALRFGLFHLLLLHFPIVLLWAAAGSTGLGLLRGSGHWQATTRYLLWTAVIACALAIVTGLTLADVKGYKASVEDHERMALITGFLTLLTALGHEAARRWPTAWLRWLERLLLLAACITVALTGHFGGEMTRDQLPF